MEKWYRIVKRHIDFKVLDLIDAVKDIRVTGKILVKTESSPYFDEDKKIGMTPSQPARYLILEKVFSHLKITSHDFFIDVGCGKGRVLAFLQSKNCPCPLYGVELSEVPAKIALDWTRNYKNIKVIFCDAFEIDYNSYSILFLCQPFWPMTFIEFIHLLEKQLFRPIILVYVFDQSSGKYLEGRKGWDLKYREEFYKIRGLQVAGGVRRYSIWSYTPVAGQLDSDNSTSMEPIPINLT